MSFLTTTQRERVTVPVPPDAGFAASLVALERIGRVKENQAQEMRAVGRMRVRGLAFATLRITVEPADDESSSVVDVTATAPEGVPPRGYAEKALSRFLEALDAA